MCLREYKILMSVWEVNTIIRYEVINSTDKRFNVLKQKNSSRYISLEDDSGATVSNTQLAIQGSDVMFLVQSLETWYWFFMMYFFRYYLPDYANSNFV